MLPLFQEIDYQDPIELFSLFADQHGAVLLDSARLMDGCGRYSYVGIDPFLVMNPTMGNPFLILQEQLALYPMQTHPHLPPMQGGVMGFFSYDLKDHLEKIRSNQKDDMYFPDMMLGFYDVVAAFDHELAKAWVFSSGYPNLGLRAEKRLRWFIRQLKQKKKISSFYSLREQKIQSNFSQESYEAAVKKVKEYIAAGDIFEANISQRFMAELTPESSPYALYIHARKMNPAPFASYLKFGDTVIASLSPERFLKMQSNKIETRPIKGTRPRGNTPEEDIRFAQELVTSEKDRAENIMIVDLLRNDLSRVCENHSVRVPMLCGLESYAHVHHLVSVVTGKLKESLGPVDLLQASFPGGSITGAPKIRAMEIIAEIEPTVRGPYCGAIGYIGFNGDMDTSVAIRTFAIKNNRVTFQAGGAIVMDSDPAAEYAETLTKAAALRRALLA